MALGKIGPSESWIQIGPSESWIGPRRTFDWPWDEIGVKKQALRLFNVFCRKPDSIVSESSNYLFIFFKIQNIKRAKLCSNGSNRAGKHTDTSHQRVRVGRCVLFEIHDTAKSGRFAVLNLTYEGPHLRISGGFSKVVSPITDHLKDIAVGCNPHRKSQRDNVSEGRSICGP